MDRATAIEDARKLFGEERAKDFERVSDASYRNARLAAERAGLSAELADQAGQIAVDVHAAAERVAKDASRSVEERRLQVEVLQTQAEAHLNEVLGENAAMSVRRSIRWELSMIAQRTRP